jgi:hypothetical protein
MPFNVENAKNLYETSLWPLVSDRFGVSSVRRVSADTDVIGRAQAVPPKQRNGDYRTSEKRGAVSPCPISLCIVSDRATLPVPVSMLNNPAPASRIDHTG